MKVTILVLTFQSVHHLEDLLPSLEQALNKEKIDSEVLVVENGRTDDSLKFVNDYFPHYKHHYTFANEYLFSLNSVVKNLDSDYVVILNDDMSVEKFGLKLAIELLECNLQLFGVNLRLTDWVGNCEQSAVRDLSYRRGYYTSQWRGELSDKIRYTLYPGGGSGVFRRSMFLTLGGFSRLYFPAYAEDMDLGWRAWHRGWPSIFLPYSWIRHKEGGTIEDLMPSNRRSRQIYTNKILCMLRNGTMPGFRVEFFLRLPYRLVISARQSTDQAFSLINAISKYKTVLSVRKTDPRPVLPDTKIFEKLGNELVL
jgi:GT2 family glycosyltransferase